MAADLTQARVRQVLAYCPDTGVFTWRSATRRRKSGDVAGSIREDGYRVIRVDGRLYRAHALAWLHVHGHIPPLIDHRNWDRLDNRIDNLREATPTVNAHNRRDAPGIGTEKRPNGRWRAVLKVGGKKRTFGTFDTQVEAKAAYLTAKRQFHQGLEDAKTVSESPKSSPGS